MSSWRARGVFGCWLMCGGASLVACGGSESAAPDVPAFGSDTAMPPAAMSPAAMPPAATPQAPSPSGSAGEGQQPPAGDAAQPSAEGVDDSVPIDPGMMSVDPP